MVHKAVDKFVELLILKVNLTRKLIFTPLITPNFTLDLVDSVQEGQFVLLIVNVDPKEEKLRGKFHYDKYIFLFMPDTEFILYPHVLELRDIPKLG